MRVGLPYRGRCPLSISTSFSAASIAVATAAAALMISSASFHLGIAPPWRPAEHLTQSDPGRRAGLRGQCPTQTGSASWCPLQLPVRKVVRRWCPARPKDRLPCPSSEWRHRPPHRSSWQLWRPWRRRSAGSARRRPPRPRHCGAPAGMRPCGEDFEGCWPPCAARSTDPSDRWRFSFGWRDPVRPWPPPATYER